MKENFYLWWEIRDTIDEKMMWLENELNHYEIIFSKNNIISLLNIITPLKNELIQIKRLYEPILTVLDQDIKTNNPNYEKYDQFLLMNNLLTKLMTKMKYIIYSIFDDEIRRRTENIEVMKNHQIARNICNFFSTNINFNDEINLEAHFGYETGYFWVPLYESSHGIINAPRYTTFFTRFLPIYCHEVAHPIIDLKWNDLLVEDVYRRGYVTTNDFISKHFDLFNIPYNPNIFGTIVSTVYSEILCDIISIILCGKSFLWAFSSSRLFPQNIVNAENWIRSGNWRTHPPNQIRFNIFIKLLYLANQKNESNLALTNWLKIQNLQNNKDTDAYITNFNDWIEAFLGEFNINDIYLRLTEQESPIYVNTRLFNHLTLDQLDHKEDPIIILNSIWNTRYDRYMNNENEKERYTSKILKDLFYSTEWRMNN